MKSRLLVVAALLWTCATNAQIRAYSPPPGFTVNEEYLNEANGLLFLSLRPSGMNDKLYTYDGINYEDVTPDNPDFPLNTFWGAGSERLGAGNGKAYLLLPESSTGGVIRLLEHNTGTNWIKVAGQEIYNLTSTFNLSTSSGSLFFIGNLISTGERMLIEYDGSIFTNHPIPAPYVFGPGENVLEVVDGNVYLFARDGSLNTFLLEFDGSTFNPIPQPFFTTTSNKILGGNGNLYIVDVTSDDVYQYDGTMWNPLVGTSSGAFLSTRSAVACGDGLYFSVRLSGAPVYTQYYYDGNVLDTVSTPGFSSNSQFNVIFQDTLVSAFQLPTSKSYVLRPVVCPVVPPTPACPSVTDIVSATVQADTGCAAGTGSIFLSLDPMADLASSSVVWTDGPSGLTRTGLSAGDYEVIVTLDFNYTCIGDDPVTDTISYTVADETTGSPLVIAPAMDTVVTAATGFCGANVDYQLPVLSGGCGTVVNTLTSGLGTGSFFPIGASTEFYQVSEDGVIISTYTITVTVQDAVAPTIGTVTPISASADPDSCGTNVSYFFDFPTITDDCDPLPNVELISGVGSGGFYPVGLTNDQYRAFDGSGNETFFNIPVTVVDDQAPQFTICPADISIEGVIASGGAIVNYSSPVAVDNCDPLASATLASGFASGSLFPFGITPVVWEATDASGNTSTCLFYVEVTAPVCNGGLPPSNPTTNVGFIVSASWDPVPGSLGCQVQGRQLGSGDFRSLPPISGIEVTGVTIPNSNLRPNRTYEWQVRCVCSYSPNANLTPWSATSMFTTPPAKIGEFEREVKAIPNPASETATIVLPKSGAVQIFSLEGKLMFNSSTNNTQVQLDVSNWAAGIYIVKSPYGFVKLIVE